MVHLTETCDIDTPHLITHVATTSAGVNDDRLTTPIHQALKAKALLPEQHLVDTGYVDGEWLIRSREDYQVDLVGPTRNNYRGLARLQTGFAADDFQINWQQHNAICPVQPHSVVDNLDSSPTRLTAW
jgi:transposase